MFSAHAFGKKSFFSTRSQSVNAALELVGRQQHIHMADQPHCYGNLFATLEYTRSFQAEKIAKFLFGKEHVVFSGSFADNRGESDVLADYFGLPFCFKSCVCFKPRISNVVLDLDWYQDLSSVVDGLFLDIHVPIVHTKWDLHPHETVYNDGTMCPTFTFYPAGYMGAEQINRDEMPINVLDAFRSKKFVGDKEPLAYGRIFGRQVASRLSDVQIALGYDMVLKEDRHFGLSVRTSIPTGTRPDQEFLFDAIVGNGHHWELGAGLTSHIRFWEREDEYAQWCIYLDANITHLFKDTQKRSFDLNNGPGSRYMLLQEFADSSVNLHINGVDAPNQYTGRILPAINATTLDACVSIAVQADIVIKFAYQRASGFEFDLGYNLWARSKEDVKLDCCGCPPFLDNRYAIKGDAQVYGFVSNDPVRLNVSQHEATLHAGQGDGNFVAGSEFRNANADNPALASDGSNVALQQLNAADAAAFNLMQAQINTSNPPILLTKNDLDISSATLPKALSHKLFFNIGHTWFELERLKPYLGAGFDVEWACACVNNNSAFSQWGMWLKGGIGY